MPRTPLRDLITFFGFIAWGDVAQMTVYRDKQGKMIWFPKTYPDKPPSQAQLDNRQRFTDIAAAWRAISQETRDQWHLATRRGSLTMHGYDLFVHWQMLGDDEAIRAVERQTQTVLLPT